MLCLAWGCEVVRELLEPRAEYSLRMWERESTLAFRLVMSMVALAIEYSGAVEDVRVER